VGGLDRLNAVVEDLVRNGPASVLLSTGDNACAPGEAGAIEYEHAAVVLKEVGLAATAVGEMDLRIGLERWREVKNRTSEGVAVLCANLRDAQGRPLVAGAALRPAGTRTVAVVAVLSPSFEPGLRAAGVDVRILPPVEAARAALREVGPADLTVLLAHAPRAEAEALARDLPEVDCTIAAHGGDLPSLDAERVGDRTFLVAGTGWRNVGQAIFGGRKGPPGLVGYETRPLSGASPPLEFHTFQMRLARQKLSEEGFLAAALAAEAKGAPAGSEFTGPTACAACHPSAHAAWILERHSRAMGDEKSGIRKRGSEHLPLCLGCHATGAGSAGGFLRYGDDQSAVTCEACHGPGAAHAADRGKTKLRDARASCASCHIPEMSPRFKFEEAWQKIAHGK